MVKSSRHRPTQRRPNTPKTSRIKPESTTATRQAAADARFLKQLQERQRREIPQRELLPSDRKRQHNQAVASQYATTFDAIDHGGKKFSHCYPKGTGANKRWVFNYLDGSRKSFLCPEPEEAGSSIERCRS